MAISKKQLTRLKWALNYDKETGVFTWKNSTSYQRENNTRAGGLTKKTGYRQVVVDKKGYQEHRLAFYFCNKPIQDNWVVYHLNKDKSDNRIKNLKLVKKNSFKDKDTGVTYSNSKKCWVATIGLNDKIFHLGVFKTKEAAEKKRKQASKILPKGIATNKGVKKGGVATHSSKDFKVTKKRTISCKECDNKVVFFTKHKRFFCNRKCKSAFLTKKDKEFRRLRKKFRIISAAQFKEKVSEKYKNITVFCRENDINHSALLKQYKRGWFGVTIANKIIVNISYYPLNVLLKKQVTSNDIKVLRKYLNLSQTEFSKLFCVSLKIISQWEKGTILPNRNNYDKFIKNLDKILNKYFKDKG